VEVAFISNPREERLLNNPSFQQQAAAAIASAITQFLTGG
jgi:N-acetylmuramoyl-L-alanine amidase